MDPAFSIQRGSTLHVPSYDDPPPKRLPIPKKDDLLDGANRLRQIMQLRDSDILLGREVRDLGRLAVQQSGWRKTDDIRDDPIMRLSQATTILDRTATIVGTLKETRIIPASANTEIAERDAERPQAFLREFVRVNNRRYMRGGGSDSLQVARVRYLATDGQCFERFCLHPGDDRYPWIAEVVDPLECFPEFVNWELNALYRCVTLRAAEIRARWGATLLPDVPDWDQRDAIAFYNDTWHAVLLDNDWLKPPKPHGYPWGIPWIITYVNGRIGSHAATKSPAWTAEETEANRGRGVIWDHISEFDQKARIWTALTDATYKAINPPINYEVDPEAVTPDPEPFDEPGKKNPRRKGLAEPRPMQRANDLPYIAAFSQSLDQAIEFGLIPQGLPGATSGNDRAIQLETYRPYFDPFITAITSHNERLYEASLQLFGKYGVETMVVGKSLRGAEYLWPFTPAMVPEKPRVILTYEEINKVDRLRALQVAATARAAGVASPQYIHRELLKTEDVEQEMIHLQEWMAMQAPGGQEILQKLYALQAVARYRDERHERGDEQGALMAEIIRRQFFKMLLAEAAGQQGAPGGPPPMPQLPSGMPPPGMGPPGLPGLGPAGFPQPGPQGPGSSLPGVNMQGTPPDVMPSQMAGQMPIDPRVLLALRGVPPVPPPGPGGF